MQGRDYYQTRNTCFSTSTRVKERDLIFALRKDPRRQQRVAELLEVWKEVKAARGSIDDLEKDLEKDLDEARAEIATLRMSQMTMLENLQTRDREVEN